MPRALKLFRTAIGFHDAYVAAPSRKAALEAWGTDKDLFARGVAEQVDDADLLKRLAQNPGEVLRAPRGSAEDHLAALPSDPEPPVRPAKSAPAKPRPPRPGDDAVRKARAEFTALETRMTQDLQKMRQKEQELARERNQMEKDHAKALDDAQERIDEAAETYERALAAWRKS